MSELTQMTIKITGVEKKIASNGAIYRNIKDENNKTYKVWETIKDGSDSAAHKVLKTMEDYGLGKTVMVGVEMQKGDFQGKPVTYRTIKTVGANPQKSFSEPGSEKINKSDIRTIALDIHKALQLQIDQLTIFTNAIHDELVGSDIIDENEINTEDLPF